MDSSILTLWKGPILVKGSGCFLFFFLSLSYFEKNSDLKANSVDPDQRIRVYTVSTSLYGALGLNGLIISMLHESQKTCLNTF